VSDIDGKIIVDRIAPL